MARDPKDDEYSKEEAEQRFLAALRGARLVGHKPLKSMGRKGVPAQSKKRRKRRAA